MAGPAGYIHIRPDNHQAYKMPSQALASTRRTILSDPRPEAHDHHSDPEYHGAAGLAQGGTDLHVYLDRADLAKVSG